MLGVALAVDHFEINRAARHARFHHFVLDGGFFGGRDRLDHEAVSSCAGPDDRLLTGAQDLAAHIVFAGGDRDIALHDGDLRLVVVGLDDDTARADVHGGLWCVINHFAAGDEFARANADGALRDQGFGLGNGRFNLEVAAVGGERFLDERLHIHFGVRVEVDAGTVGIDDGGVRVGFRLHHGAAGVVHRLVLQLLDLFAVIDLRVAIFVRDVELADRIFPFLRCGENVEGDGQRRGQKHGASDSRWATERKRARVHGV